MDITKFFQYMVAQGASDLFLKTFSRPAIRVDGRIRFIADMPLSQENMWDAFDKLLDETCKENFEEFGEADFSVNIPNIGRFRANVFRHMSEHGMVFRHVQSKIASFEELHLPESGMKRLANLSRGLVLATGVAGSGKSTTLASLLQHINETLDKHVVTVEDPIEFIFKEKTCIFSQREVGIDTESFSAALKHAMRQSPDVLLIGEMRDKDTVEAAINAAETGHLVFSTLHTLNAVQTGRTDCHVFPHPTSTRCCANNLPWCWKESFPFGLSAKKPGKGAFPAIELLLGTPTIKEILAEGRTLELTKALTEGTEYFGTMTFNQSLINLYKTELITQGRSLECRRQPRRA